MPVLAASNVTPIVSPVPTPVDNTFNTSFMNFVGDTLDTFTHMDIVLILKVILIWIAVVWLVFTIWAAIDASSRYDKWYIPILWFLFILPGNILGFIGYMLIRPALTVEEKEYLNLESKYIRYELLNAVECPRCGIVVSSDVKYCPHCGYELTVKCKKCGKEQSVFNSFCVNCGNALNTRIKLEKLDKFSEFDPKKDIKKNVMKSRTKVDTNVVDLNATRDEKVFNQKISNVKKPVKFVMPEFKVDLKFIKKLNPFPVIIKVLNTLGGIAEKVGDITIKIVLFPFKFPFILLAKLKKNTKKRKDKDTAQNKMYDSKNNKESGKSPIKNIQKKAKGNDRNLKKGIHKDKKKKKR